MRDRGLATLCAALIVLAACSGGNDQASPPTGATVGTEPPRTTTTDPYAVPAVIDAAYVNRVLAGLDAAVGDVVRMVVSTKTIPREAYDRLRALYGTDSLLQFKLDSFQSDLREQLPGYRPNPGNKRTSVSELLSVARSCVFVKVIRDYSEVSTNASLTADIQWIAVRPLDNSRDPARYNTVGWTYVYEGFERGGRQPTDPCANS